jgi:hypothetical protein
MELGHGRQTPQSRHQQQMLVGDGEQTSTNRPQDCLRWKIVWCVKGLMNHPILNVATNVGLLRTHTRGRGSIKLERTSGKREHATVIRECSKERQSLKIGTVERGWNTTITTATPNVSRKLIANLQQETQGLPPLANYLVCEGLNEPPNSQGRNQCGIITHTPKGER